MGVSASSLLDDTTAAHVTDRAEAELQDFSPYYRGQYSAALFTQVEEDLEPRKEKIRQLLKQKEVAEDGEVLYEDGLLYFDENRKWRERYVVVRANHCLECHDGLETFLKGVPPRHKLLPTGGAVFTTEEKYMAAVDQCFPDECSEKEDFAPAVAGLPGQFPVYLRLPYRRDSYFCFRQQSKRDRFLSVLSDCIRHQNHDFLKKESVEVQSFLRAVQLYRQDQGHYDSWELLVGSDVRVMGNLVMEQLLPSLETELLPRLKAKKAEKKRVWFATVEAAYVLAQQRLLEGLTALKEECRSSNRQQEVLMLSDMDQIVVTRRRLKEAVRAEVQQPLQQLCEEAVQPHLEELLEELLQPISCGFLEGRRQAEQQMDVVCQDALRGDTEQVQQALLTMSRPNLLNCYQKVATLQEKLPLLQQRFGFSNMTALIDRAELELQQLMENTAFTFQQLLFKAVDQHPDEQQTAVEKVKHRVLKHYDYDSSSVRKRISREALVSITLPFIKRNLEKSCKTALQGLQQLVSEDHAHFIHVFNIYEDVLLSGLDLEVCKVVREAAALRKYDLFSDSRDLLSQSSRSSLSSPPSSPASPAKNPAQLVQANGLCGPRKEEKPEEQEMNQGASQMEVVMVHETQQEVEAAPQTQQKVDTEAPQMQQEVETEAPQTQQEVKAEAPQTQQEVKAAAPQVEQEVDTEAPQTQQEVETEAPQTQQEVKAAAPQVEQEVETEAPRVQREVEAEAPQTQQEVKAVAPQVQQEVETEAPQVQQEVESEAPQVQQEVEAVAPQVQQGVETEVPQTSQEIKVAQKKLKEVEAEAPQTQQEVEAKLQPPEDDGVAPPCVQDCHQDQELLQPLFEFQNAQEVAAVSSGSIPGSGLGQSGQTSGDPEKETSTEAPPTEPSQQETCSASESPPPDSVREIRDLVVEVIEVEELLQRYPSGIPASQ